MLLKICYFNSKMERKKEKRVIFFTGECTFLDYLGVVRGGCCVRASRATIGWELLTALHG